MARLSSAGRPGLRMLSLTASGPVNCGTTIPVRCGCGLLPPVVTLAGDAGRHHRAVLLAGRGGHPGRGAAPVRRHDPDARERRCRARRLLLPGLGDRPAVRLGRARAAAAVGHRHGPGGRVRGRAGPAASSRRRPGWRPACCSRWSPTSPCTAPTPGPTPWSPPMAAVASYVLVRALGAGHGHQRRWWVGYGVSVAVLGILNIFGLLLVAAHAVTMALRMLRPEEGQSRKALAVRWTLSAGRGADRGQPADRAGLAAARPAQLAGRPRLRRRDQRDQAHRPADHDAGRGDRVRRRGRGHPVAGHGTPTRPRG